MLNSKLQFAENIVLIIATEEGFLGAETSAASQQLCHVIHTQESLTPLPFISGHGIGSSLFH